MKDERLYKNNKLIIIVQPSTSKNNNLWKKRRLLINVFKKHAGLLLKEKRKLMKHEGTSPEMEVFETPFLYP